MLSIVSWTTDRKVVINDLEFQVDIDSAHKVNSRKYLIAAHQSLIRLGNPKKANKVNLLDNIEIRKWFWYIDGVKYIRDSVLINYNAID